MASHVVVVGYPPVAIIVSSTLLSSGLSSWKAHIVPQEDEIGEKKNGKKKEKKEGEIGEKRMVKKGKKTRVRSEKKEW